MKGTLDSHNLNHTFVIMNWLAPSTRQDEWGDQQSGCVLIQEFNAQPPLPFKEAHVSGHTFNRADPGLPAYQKLGIIDSK